MADNLREQSAFRKEKTPIVRQYIGDHNKLMSEIAGRGFLKLPGYAADLENELELRLKLGLSEINYKILSQTIERELKQAGLAYDLAYRTAVITWETEKQELMAAWDAELSGIRQGMAAEEEVKTRLAIEVAARQVALITAKTAIEEEIEGYRLQLANLEDDTSAYEVQLANAKLLTAQRKLAVIPILEEIIVKEGELLNIEVQKSAEFTNLMNAKREIAGKQGLLIPGYQELANATRQHASLIPSQVIMEQQIANEKLAQANAVIDKSQNQLDELEIEIDTANKQVEIDSAKRNLQETQFNNEHTLTRIGITNENEYLNAVDGMVDHAITVDRETTEKLLDDKSKINDITNDTRYDHAATITEAEVAAAASVNAYEINAMGEIADIEAAQKITAKLTHLIG